MKEFTKGFVVLAPFVLFVIAAIFEYGILNVMMAIVVLSIVSAYCAFSLNWLFDRFL